MPVKRTAVTTASADRVEPYLPSNYTVKEEDGQTIIQGYDNRGYTLDGYVIPRLASGLIGAKEITE